MNINIHILSHLIIYSLCSYINVCIFDISKGNKNTKLNIMTNLLNTITSNKPRLITVSIIVVLCLCALVHTLLYPHPSLL